MKPSNEITKMMEKLKEELTPPNLQWFGPKTELISALLISSTLVFLDKQSEKIEELEKRIDELEETNCPISEHFHYGKLCSNHPNPTPMT